MILLPNAFTVGYGRNAVIVFSLGLLNMLDLNELTAVASHELAHVKARDYHIQKHNIRIEHSFLL